MTPLDAENNRLQKAILFAASEGRCFICADPAHDIAHIYTRANYPTRWDTHDGGNCVMLCRSCHSLQHSVGREKLIEEFIDVYGTTTLWELRERTASRLPMSKEAWAEQENKRMKEEQKAHFGSEGEQK